MSQKTVRKKPRLNRKFRFQLLAQWLNENHKPCRVADIGGGKGLLSYLLINNGWDATVIDPFYQLLPYKYKDLLLGKRLLLTPEQIKSIKRITEPFEIPMAKDFNLLIGLHAHGSNMKIIQAAKKYGTDFILLPCCVVDEPIIKQPGINWLESLIEYAQSLGFKVKTDKLNFAGQRTLIYAFKDS